MLKHDGPPTHYRHIGVVTAENSNTNAKGVAIYSKDGNCRWLFTNPEDLHRLAVEIDQHAAWLVREQQGKKIELITPALQRKVEKMRQAGVLAN